MLNGVLFFATTWHLSKDIKLFSFDKKNCIAKLDELPTCCRFIENFSRDDISACSGDILFDFELIN